MENINFTLLIIFELGIFLSTILMHLARRNSTLLVLYAFQSIIVALMILVVGLNTLSMSLGVIALLTFLVKVVAAPRFFTKYIGFKQLEISTTSYLNTPITLGIILGLTIFVKSSIFSPIISIFPETNQGITMALAGILTSLFLVINRRGIFPQLIGILSFENELVAFGILAGLEQTLVIEIGILFDLLLWIIIASVLVTFIYSHFGSVNSEQLNRLKD